MNSAERRVRTYLSSLPQFTPVTQVGELFDIKFLKDAEVSSWARANLGIKLWRLGKDSRSIRQKVGEDMVQLRLDWYLCKDVSEIDQMIAENVRQIRGNARTLRDLRAVANAMRQFPGVTAGEAARLAGVKLDVLTMPEVAEG